MAGMAIVPARARANARALLGTEKGLSAWRTCLVVHTRYLACQVDEIKAGGASHRLWR